MKAVVYHRHGGPEELVLAEVPDPVCGPHDVLVDIHAAAINPVDWKIRMGTQRAVNPQRFPARTGLDLSGVVAQVGSAVTGFSVGDAVYASPHHRRGGTLAERLAVRAVEVAPKPRNLSQVEAASIPLVGLTAWDCLVVAAGLQPGERALIGGGSGGVGTFAVQLAAALGAECATTCSAVHADFVRSLGAQHVVDHRTQRWQDVLPPQDVVLDILGPRSARESLAHLRPGGRVASINSGLVPASKRWGPWLAPLVTAGTMARNALTASLQGKRLRSVMRTASGTNLAAITEHIEAGRIRAGVGRVLDLDAAAEAHRLGEAGAVRGKIVLKVR